MQLLRTLRCCIGHCFASSWNKFLRLVLTTSSYPDPRREIAMLPRPSERISGKNEKPADIAGLRQALAVRKYLERAKGLEPSTPTLARSGSVFPSLSLVCSQCHNPLKYKHFPCPECYTVLCDFPNGGPQKSASTMVKGLRLTKRSVDACPCRKPNSAG